MVEDAGASPDAIMLPRIASVTQVAALGLLLTQIGKTMGYEAGRIGTEAQIGNALRA